MQPSRIYHLIPSLPKDKCASDANINAGKIDLRGPATTMEQTVGMAKAVIQRDEISSDDGKDSPDADSSRLER